jgi:hypothetical protein
VARLALSLNLKGSQCRNKSRNAIDLRFHEKIGDHAENLHIRLGWAIEARGVYEDNGVTIGGVGSSNSSNIRCARPQ